MYFRKIIMVILLCASQIPSYIQAQESTIESLVASAIENDPILKQLDKKISVEKTREGDRFSYPPLQISYGFFALPIETRSGPQRHKISAKQVFPWPGLSASAGRVPGKMADLIHPQKALRIRKLRYNVERLAWTLWHHQKQVTLTQAHMVLIDGLLSSTRSLSVIGRIRKSAVSLVTLEKAKVVDRFDKEKSEVEVARTSLERWTGTKIKGVLFEPLSDVKIPEATTSGSHPRIDLLDGKDELDRSKIAVEEKRDMPSFSIGVDYFEIGENENENSGQDAVMAGVGVSIPLWSNPSNSEIDAIRGSIVARKFERENLKREILSTSQIERLKTKDHLRQIRFLEKTIIPLAEVYRADLTAEFETDRAKIQDVIQALDRVFRLKLELADAQAKFEKSRSRQVFESAKVETP